MQKNALNGLNIPVNTTNTYHQDESAVNNSESVNTEVSELKRQISNELDYVDRSAVDSAIVEAISLFLEDLSDKVVAINKGKISNKKNHVAFGRALVMDMLIAKLEPALNDKYEQGSFGKLIYIEAELWPLRAGYIASKGQLDLINKNLKKTMDSFSKNRGDFKFRFYTADEIQHALETTHFIWNLLSIIGNTIKGNSLAWCEFCFRRSEPNFVTCRLHLSGNDTEYKRATRIDEQYRGKEKAISARYQALRDLFKGKVNLANKEFNSEDNENYLSTDVELINQNIENYWLQVREHLFVKIKEEFPQVAYKIRTIKIEDIPTWSQFVKHLYKALEEPLETNEHPFFVLKLLEIAEIYFIYENAYGDTRKNSTEKNILKLFAEGLKQVQIAKQLNISAQRVS